MDIKDMYGYIPEMDGMIKTWDREEHNKKADGVKTFYRYTSDRCHYRAKVKHPCKTCGTPTRLVIDYLGRLEFCCGPHINGRPAKIVY